MRGSRSLVLPFLQVRRHRVPLTVPQLLRGAARGLPVACSLSSIQRNAETQSCQRLAKSSKRFVNTIQLLQPSGSLQSPKYGSKLSSRKLSLLCHRTTALSTLSVQTDMVSLLSLPADVQPSYRNKVLTGVILTLL